MAGGSRKGSPIELWRWVVGHEGNYQVSSFGRVRSVARLKTFKDGRRPYWIHDRILKQGVGNYLFVGLRKGNECPRYNVHVLVLGAFVGPPPIGMECRHLDGNWQNNRLDNLCWGTAAENSKDKVRHGTVPRGSNAPHSKLTKSQVLSIRRRYQEGATQKALAKRYKIHQVTVSEIVTRKIWKHI